MNGAAKVKAITQHLKRNRSNAKLDHFVLTKVSPNCDPVYRKFKFQSLFNFLEVDLGGMVECCKKGIFIAGDNTSAGKSTISMSLLHYLAHNLSFPFSQLAYTKPATVR